MDYLIAIEKGLRNYAVDVHTMGTHALRSPKYWGSVDKWRKREAYIALVRFLLGCPADYKQWDCFSFEDYTQRQTLSRTFDVRHFHLSDGNDKKHFEGWDFDWSKHHYSPRKRGPTHRANVKKEQPVNQPSKKSSTEHAKVPMIFDVELGCLVPMNND